MTIAVRFRLWRWPTKMKGTPFCEVEAAKLVYEFMSKILFYGEMRGTRCNK